MEIELNSLAATQSVLIEIVENFPPKKSKTFPPLPLIIQFVCKLMELDYVLCHTHTQTTHYIVHKLPVLKIHQGDDTEVTSSLHFLSIHAKLKSVVLV
jgi:hypothetical protein